MLGDAVGLGLTKPIGFNGATLLLLALFAIGSSLFFGISWLKVMERIGAAFEAAFAWVRRRREEAVDRRIGDAATAAREMVVGHLREEEVEREPILVVPPVVSVAKSERVVKEKQRPLFTDMPDSPLPPLDLLEDAPSSQEIVSNETLEYTSRRIERKLADFGVSAKVLAAIPAR
jgi:S-DNA-T family DNA segregation ATPase FtsK/SpoIIIE